MRIAHLCSAHGFGHLTRQLALGEHLRAAGQRSVFFTIAPAAVVEETLPGAAVVPWQADVGLVQHDSLTEDIPATVAALSARCSEAAIDALAAAVSGFDRAVVDIAPPAMEAVRRAGVPALVVGNFDWPWIYRHYPALRDTAERLARWQRPHRAVALWPGPGLSGFAQVRAGGLIGRQRPAHPLPPRSVLVSFGGLGLRDLSEALPELPGVRWVLAPPMAPLERPDALFVRGVPYPALVAGAAAVLTKPGYGIFAEAALAGTPLVWVERGAFPEAPYLTAAMAARGDLPLPCPPSSPDFPAALAAALAVIFTRARPAPRHHDTAALAQAVLRLR